MTFHDRFHRGESDAEPCFFLSVLSSMERVKDIGKVIRIDARPLVDDREPDLFLLLVRYQENRSSFLGILDGVVQQIAQGSLQPGRIRLDNRQGIIGAKGKLQAPSRRPGFVRLVKLVHFLVQGRSAEIQFQLAALDP